MPKKVQEEWISTAEAARILTANSGHPVADAYVRRLGLDGKLTTKQIDARTKQYLKSDVESYTVKSRGDGSVRRTVRKDAREKREKAATKEQTESAA